MKSIILVCLFIVLQLAWVSSRHHPHSKHSSKSIANKREKHLFSFHEPRAGEHSTHKGKSHPKLKKTQGKKKKKIVEENGRRVIYYDCIEAKRKREAAKVKKLYRDARKINKDFFALTRTESRNFSTLMLDEEVVQPPVTCNRKFPKYTDCKIKELSDILNRTDCSATNPPTTPTMTTTFSALPARRDEIRQRHRREVGTTTRNPDGSVTTIRMCFDRATLSVNRNLRLCSFCAATTELPQNRFPRFLNEIVCLPENTDGRTCLSREGSCYQNFLNLNFRIDSNNVGPNRLGEWQTYSQSIRTFCSCQVLRDSAFFAPFV